MKIQFVKGTREYEDGDMTIWSDYHQAWILGNYHLTTYLHRKKLVEKIVVVKQKSVWFTLLILIHELAHWFVRKFITKKSYNKYDEWIEDHLRG